MSAPTTRLATLRADLEALPLVIDDVSVRSDSVSIDSYGEEPRPTSTVTLSSRDLAGYGEHVGWTKMEHSAFREAARGVARGTTTVGAWTQSLAKLPPYDRAALEAAAIDLALRQTGTTLLHLAGVEPRPVRYVVSFTPGEDPIADARRFGAGGVELKIDADPGCSETTWRAIASVARVAVIDFKLRGGRADYDRAGAAVGGAWMEDAKPGEVPSALMRRWSVDGPVASVAALDKLRPQPSAVNVKAPRMGGVLEAISCLATCESRGIPTYIGGMFEIGVARRQSLALATIACPDGPNDIAPLRTAPSRQPLVLGSLPGFAGDPDA